MHYSYEFKLMCVELYLSGSYPDIPEGVNPDTLKSNIRQWARLVDLHGPEVLKHKVFNKVWTPEEKFELVSKVIAGIPKKKVAIEAGINPGMLYQWLHKYKLQGYNGLVESKKGRPTKEPRMKKSTNPLPLTESEREELIRLRAENEYIKAENEVIKKRIALRQEKWAAQLEAKKQRSSMFPRLKSGPDSACPCPGYYTDRTLFSAAGSKRSWYKTAKSLKKYR